MGDWIDSASEYESNALLSLNREDYEDSIYWFRELKKVCNTDIIYYGLGISYYNTGVFETSFRNLSKINIENLYRIYSDSIISKKELLNLYSDVCKLTNRDGMLNNDNVSLDDQLLRVYMQLYDKLRRENMSYSSDVVFDIFSERLHIIHFFAMGRDVDEVINVVNSRQPDCEPASYDYIVSIENIHSTDIVTLYSIYKAKFDNLNLNYRDNAVIDMFNMWIDILLEQFNRTVVK